MVRRRLEPPAEVPARLLEWRPEEWVSPHEWSAARLAWVQEHGPYTRLGDELDAIRGAAYVILHGGVSGP